MKNPNSLKSKRKVLTRLLCIGFIIGLPFHVVANDNVESPQVTQQQVLVSGIVSDPYGEPIIGVNVMEKGTSNGSITDMNGEFKLTVQPGAILKISYLGFITQEVKVSESKKLSITMQENTQLLNEVVVVGFGTQKKINLTGAVDVVSGKDLMERPIANATQALQGLIPGLQIMQDRGSLEKTPSINVRGTTTIGEGTSGNPLILIDGMEASLNSVNPQDIENISVLKDAAASSIYGSRAPFGVILITTKSGRKDGKVKVNYNNSFRFGTPTHVNRSMNSVNFATWINDTKTNSGGGVMFDEEWLGDIIEYRNAKPYGPGSRITDDGRILYSTHADGNGQFVSGYTRGINDVDWYDVLFKKWNFSQEHNFSVSGGNEKFNYYVSGAFFDLDGLIKLGDGENLQRYTVTAKINSKITNWLTFDYSMRFTREDYDRSSRLEDGAFSNFSQNAWPILPVEDRNGHYFYSSDASPLGMAEGGRDKKQTDNIYNQLGFIIEPIKNWKTHVRFNYRINNNNRHWDYQTLYNHDMNGSPYRRTNSSHVHEDYYKENYLNFNAYTEYSHTFAEKHNFHIMGGLQAEELKQTKFGMQRDGIMIPSKPEIDLTSGLDVNGNPITPGVNGERNDWAVLGGFGRFNYDFAGRYLLELNLRTDGTSRFRKGNRWKTFPSVSVGWNLAQENFFESLRSNIDMLKFRASYGSLGNQNTDNWYQTYLTMSVKPVNGGWLMNGVKPNIATAPGLISESLTWETIETYNLGLDWSAFRSRFTGSFNWYIRNTKDMVGKTPQLPAMLGTDVPKTNNTDLQTKGWELTIGWRDMLKNGFSYGAKFMLYDSRTKITRYPNNPTSSIKTYVEGRYINEIWGYETIGIAKTDEEMQQHLASLSNGGQDQVGSNWSAGDIMYRDLDGDGKISRGNETVDNHGDLKVIGDSSPRFQFGLDLNAAWKGFDLRVFFQGVMKRDVWQGSNYLFGAGHGSGEWSAFGITSVNDYFRDGKTWSVENGHSNENINSYLPRPLYYTTKNMQTQTRYLQNAAYVRLKNLQLGYTLPSQLTSKWKIEKVRVFFSGENLWTGTNLVEQFDPETVAADNGNAYPLSKTLSFGLSLTF